MSECFVTMRDIRTRFNPVFHAIKIKKIRDEIEEMYHAGTTISNYNYELGTLTVRSGSAEDVALAIIDKSEHLHLLLDKHKRYIEVHEQALDKYSRYEHIILYFQSGLYSYEEVAQVFSLTRERIRQIIDGFRQELSGMMTNDDIHDEPISDEEIEQLSAIIEENVMYEPKPIDKSLDPLHGMAQWHQEGINKRTESKRKHKAEMSAV